VRERPAHWFYDSAIERPVGTLHITDLNRLLSAAAGAEGSAPAPELRVSSADAQIVGQLLAKEKLSEFIIINPGGGWGTKRWHPAKYADLCDRIRTKLDLGVVVTTGPDEDELYEGIRRNCKSAPLHFRLGFLQMIPLMQRALLLVGGDSGPLHLACAIGTPVVGVFGPTSPGRNGPWSSQDEAVVRQLCCSFCHKRKCPTRNECMDISVDEVFGAIVRRLSALK
jgi:ADP-heptose:LPS heptosyltransferase